MSWPRPFSGDVGIQGGPRLEIVRGRGDREEGSGGASVRVHLKSIDCLLLGRAPDHSFACQVVRGASERFFHGSTVYPPWRLFGALLHLSQR